MAVYGGTGIPLPCDLIILLSAAGKDLEQTCKIDVITIKPLHQKYFNADQAMEH